MERKQKLRGDRRRGEKQRPFKRPAGKRRFDNRNAERGNGQRRNADQEQPGQSDSGKQRIQKLLAGAGIASRRKVEEMVRAGRVAVNGKVVTQLPILIDPQTDRVEVDDERVALAEKRGGPRIYILLNKPKHVYATNVAQGEQVLAVDLLPRNLPGRVYPVGRLEADAKGLLLLTNDGELTHRLTHPRYGVAKTYRAIVDSFITPEEMAALSKGLWLEDGGPARPAGIAALVKIVSRSRAATVLDITLREGRTGQIRQMLAGIGHKLRDLTRVKMGPLTLEGLPPGKYRSLTSKEISQLRAIGEKGELAVD
jgi:pseudouridine synthase